jgi:transposase-like protein
VNRLGVATTAGSEAVPGVVHRTGRYRTNGIARDRGFVKERLRTMRGLKSVASAALFMCGHALMRQHPSRFLADRGVRPAAGGIRVDVEPTR